MHFSTTLAAITALIPALALAQVTAKCIPHLWDRCAKDNQSCLEGCIPLYGVESCTKQCPCNTSKPLMYYPPPVEAVTVGSWVIQWCGS